MSDDFGARRDGPDPAGGGSGGRHRAPDGGAAAGPEAGTRPLPTAERPPAEEAPAEAAGPAYHPQPAVGRVRRLWSSRRVPAALLALVVLGASALLLYDLAVVRAGGSAAPWRRTLAQDLAHRPLDDVFTTIGAAVAVVLGLWLLVLALTPGVRAVLPMRRPGPHVRPVLTRPAAALVLRDRAMEVPGVQSVRLKVGRRRAKAKAVSHFRDLDEVREDLRDTLEESVDRLGLAHRLHTRVRVRRPARR
ncbi:DUF6286 domain-containing protein [Streptomyces sp. NPDC059740]|uniref:DUF6286 domain-containing protein n=1 Tax=Streptomyces sp. NPDC059740 TaxID=3346926 RepID=UPI00366148E4